MDKFLETAGYPTTIGGMVLFLFFYLRRAETGMRAEINGSLARLQQEKTELRAEIERLEQEAQDREVIFDELRTARREAEDREYAEKRRAESAEIRLKDHGLM